MFWRRRVERAPLTVEESNEALMRAVERKNAEGLALAAAKRKRVEQAVDEAWDGVRYERPAAPVIVTPLPRTLPWP